MQARFTQSLRRFPSRLTGRRRKQRVPRRVDATQHVAFESLEAREMLTADPIAVADLAIVNRNSFVDIELRLNDSDADGDALTVLSAAGASNGTVATNGDGTVRYTPSADFTGTDSFTYTLSDGDAGTNNATATVTVNVVANGAGNSAPVVPDKSYTGQFADDVFMLMGSGLLAGDSDANGDAVSLVALNGNRSAINTQVTLLSGARVTVSANGPLEYHPETSATMIALPVGDSAVEAFTVTASDGNGGLTIVPVSITVNGVNDAPTATDDNFATGEDSLLTGGNLISDDNGNGIDSDPDTGDTLSVTRVNGSAANV
ncbi:MAG: tandem-95 repeat protein, partial [Planctomycetales bacterium]|nr:tandem-95 repeat protein [Planctomycetales bacterium]